jgi:predicted short-subunit dehydrogenase-like oxidoreductase (DUF2520 family)
MKKPGRERNWKAVIIGAGSAAAGMLRGLSSAGIPVAAVAGRTRSACKSLLERAGVDGVPAFTRNAEAARRGDLVLLAVPDKAAAEVAAEIAREGGLEAGDLVVHLSGALTSGILDPALALGARIGSLHPLVSFATDPGEADLRGTTFAVEGPPDVVDDLEEIVRRLGAVPVAVPSEFKPLYHAAAAVVSNFTVSIFDMGATLFETIGIQPEPGLRGLVALLRSTLQNIAAVGVPGALTGPIARGDTKTVEGHLKALKEKAPGFLPVYASLGMHTIDVALRKGSLKDDEAEVMKMMFARHL